MIKPVLIPRPGVRCGPYPEQTSSRDTWVFYWAELLRARMLAARNPASGERRRFLNTVRAQHTRIAGCDKEFLVAGIRRLRAKLILEGLREDLIAEAFALVGATMRMHLKVDLYDTQFLAAWLMLDRRLVEMQTGEGKTLAVALAASTCALAGIPVHVVTGNDYLVERDAALLKPVFEALGLSVGAVTGGTPAEQRVAAYRCDTTYCTAKEVVFDYLRDHVDAAHEKRRLRGLCMAIVDEADSVLIDEARLPLVLSESLPDKEQAAFCRQALFLAAQLRSGKDFLMDAGRMLARLTEEGQRRAQRLAEHVGGAWHGTRRREETLCLALAAQHLFVRDVHYLVQDRQVVIIDDTTGRPAHGRVWSRGLHQLIEAKEGCPITRPSQTAAQLTFQRFFSRYLRLSGVSGTLAEARGPLLAMYGLPVARVPLRVPSRRRVFDGRVFLRKTAQWRYVADRVRELHAEGRPVLVGTDSVSDSETLSARLEKAGIRHVVLNARFDADEAGIVAQAGQRGAVTVSTNMAGRGTDIALGEGVAALGGLHVIACQTNDSRRIDRQLFGRCARQGDPGSVQQLYCLEDRFRSVSTCARGGLRVFGFSFRMKEMPRWLAAICRIDQMLRERRQRREQWFSFLNDRRRDRQLAFIGKGE